MPIVGSRILAPLVVAGAILTAIEVGSPDTVLTVTVTMPPIADLQTDETMRDNGTVGNHAAGHYWLLGSTHYVWYRLNGAGFDPGPHVAALSGRTGIMVTLTAGNNDAPTVASASASAISAIPAFSGTSANGSSVVVQGTDSAAGGSVDWNDAIGDFGILGNLDLGILGAGGSFAAPSLRGSQLDMSSISEPVIITGFRTGVGNVHTGQFVMALYQGGIADDNFLGATLLGLVGVTSGTATNTFIFAGGQGVLVDPSLGRVWAMGMHDDGVFEAPFVATTTGIGASNQYIYSGTQGVFIATGGPSSSDPDDLPATLPAVDSSTVGTPSVAFSYVTASNFATNMRMVVPFGTRFARGEASPTSTFPQTSGNPLLVGNSFLSPDVPGMTMRRHGVNYQNHVLNSDYRSYLATGGTADNNFFGATFFDLGQTSGSANGWNYVSHTGSNIAIPANTRCWMMLEYDGGASQLSFDSGGPDTYGPDTNPAAYYNGNTSESEADDGTLGQAASTNLDFDPTVPIPGTDDPAGATVTPNGFNYQNNNNVGVAWEGEVLGFEVQPAA